MNCLRALGAGVSRGLSWRSALAIALAALLSGPAYGTAYFQVVDGDWNTASNWAGGLPSSTSSAFVGTTVGGGLTTATARIDGNVGGSTNRITLTIGAEAGTNGTVIHTTGTAYLNGPTVGNSGTGTYTQNGGSVVGGGLYLGQQATGVGTYNLNGASLSTTAVHIGNWGTGTFNQVGGTHTVSSGTTYNAVILGELNSGASNYGRGTYNLSGNGTLTIARATGTFPTPSAVLEIGRYGTGTFNIGDATSGGTINESGTTGPAVDLSVGRFSAGGNPAGSKGTLQGWGTIDLRGVFTNNGRVIADGYGTDRSLSMTSFASVTNSLENTTTNGWFAQNHGKLMLPALSITSATSSYNWGEGFDTSIDLVNSVRMTFTGVSTPGSVAVALLASDRTDVPAGLVNPIGVWEFISTGLQFASVDLTFRYDEAAVLAAGLLESDLELYRYDGTGWTEIMAGISLDAAANRLTATGLTSFSQYAIATGVPEPASVVMLILGGLAILAPRRR